MKSSEPCTYGFTQAKRKFDSEEIMYVLLFLLASPEIYEMPYISEDWL
jgi:hypothetical protein